MITIDGSIKEGGGQVLRIATSLAVLLQKGVTIKNIRAGRKKPGLAAQHLKGLELASLLCNGKLTGAFISSQEVSFTPGKIASSGDFNVNIPTAGSLVLLLQTALPIMVFSKGILRLQLTGGTNADMAPPIDFYDRVFKEIVFRMGVKFNINLVRRGFYPQGNGIVQVETFPLEETLSPLVMIDPGKATSISGLSFVAGSIPMRVAEEEADAARNILTSSLSNSVRITIETKKENDKTAFGNGTATILIGETSTNCIIGADGLGKKGKPAKEVGEEAANNLLLSLGNHCVDEHMQDQLLIWMALAGGESRIKSGPLTLHSETAIEIIEQIVGKKIFSIEELSNDSIIIYCQGINLWNQINENE